MMDDNTRGFMSTLPARSNLEKTAVDARRMPAFWLSSKVGFWRNHDLQSSKRNVCFREIASPISAAEMAARC
ncbi:hypothetical protein AncyloWKF20_18275 [Ancylobacter sp. WKF20]|uniref:hypothetical protein n=1 Tax=Ancylobacter sp. WKF20 TaxID=3039801 RepID=UPI00243465EE|nr:hypothetical protein [Ancylobacter sp. WKF20]WGD29685.1 hypothetical protein AncyloWKF20_18275 [Ancylobacter sp. WKF20]